MPLGRASAVERLRVRLAKLHTARMLVWDDLKYFLAFARVGSMQAAAKVLGVNQSTVQRRIADLEERVGRRLVERHFGGYRLTELGEELRPTAEGVDAAVAAFERRPDRPEDIGRHLVVACRDSIAHYPGARWLQSVAPDATIATRSDNWPGLVLAVKSGAGLAALLAFKGDSESDLICVIDDIDLITPYYLLMHRDMQKTPRMRAAAGLTNRMIAQHKTWCRYASRMGDI
jgi:DNA-binding transcriptional LysR family regulator